MQICLNRRKRNNTSDGSEKETEEVDKNEAMTYNTAER